MIDEAPKKGRYYYRMVISPDPRREDRYKDLDLRTLTIATMLKLEERYGKSIQFVAAIHDDHAPHRHVHALVILNGRRLTRADFAALRDHARNRALTQRRYMDRVRRLELLEERSSSYRPPFAFGGNTSVSGTQGQQGPRYDKTARVFARRDSAKAHTLPRLTSSPMSVRSAADTRPCPRANRATAASRMACDYTASEPLSVPGR